MNANLVKIQVAQMLATGGLEEWMGEDLTDQISDAGDYEAFTKECNRLAARLLKEAGISPNQIPNQIPKLN